ncbi:MAG: UDP-N-acetylmuramoyl-L-alanyl-D-glutamate--2,6-diaminopimelate ligase [Gammaproteobacteria bacterium]|nr:UDP-N-acetylmuramoyl-L-alanyl-D-glutamate--2,6-diaminopimelate ligase [Gammaproteobacteria bacterium]
MVLHRHKPTTVPLSRVLDSGSHGDVRIQGLQLDSRQLKAGEAFLAVSGAEHDGRDYCAQAAAAGAAVIIAEKGLSRAQRSACAAVPVVEVAGLVQQLGRIAARYYGEPAASMRLFGITGTNGKTTTSRLLAQLLRRQFGRCGVIGTLGATLGDDISDAVNTTPDAVSLQRVLAEWHDLGVALAALEVSSHSLDQGRVNGLSFDTAIFTNLSQDHLDYHGDMVSYGLAKSRLFRDSQLQTAIVNADDPYSAFLRDVLAPGVQLLTYSVQGTPSTVVASNVSFHDSGLAADIETPWGEGVLRSPLAAEFNLSNLLAALAAACNTGMPLQSVLDCTLDLQGAPGRMEYVPNDLGLQIVIDYAHTPAALQQALHALRAHTRGSLICVFGCGGDRDAGKRPLMGQVATAAADRVIVTSDNPRTESPQKIISDIEAGCIHAPEIEVDRAAAIALAVATAEPDDCVLIAGKGHETYQQLGARRLPFSDIQQVRLALTGRQVQ